MVSSVRAERTGPISSRAYCIVWAIPGMPTAERLRVPTFGSSDSGSTLRSPGSAMSSTLGLLRRLELVGIMTTRRAIVRIEGSEQTSTPDDLAVESPLVLALDGDVLATLMRTPGHDIELTAGWLVVESGVATADDVAVLRECRDDDTDRVHITLRAGVRPPVPRAFVTSAACGVCSADLLDLDLLPPAAPHSPGWTVSPDRLIGLPPAMRAQQRTFDRTGAVHAAALATSGGELLIVREDVGRHNAVDKVFGRALLDGRLPATDHLLVVSGRVSFEIVQKAVAAGVAGIVAVSAPSSLAVDLCRRYDVLLAGMLRGARLNVYAGADRLSSAVLA